MNLSYLRINTVFSLIATISLSADRSTNTNIYTNTYLHNRLNVPEQQVLVNRLETRYQLPHVNSNAPLLRTKQWAYDWTQTSCSIRSAVHCVFIDGSHRGGAAPWGGQWDGPGR